MRKINAKWHAAHRIPMPSTLDQRVTWHLAHVRHCGCRTDLPPTIVAELKRRGVRVPVQGGLRPRHRSGDTSR